jgi:uncharacterized membrane protein YcaP (DUF421 family)
MPTDALAATAGRAVAIYAVMLVMIRFMGKRAVGNFSAFDLLVALMLGDLVGAVVYGDVPFAQGLVAILPIAALEYGNSWLTYWNRGFDKMLEGEPTIVVRHGEFQRRGMRRERMSEHDVVGALRLNGIDNIKKVRFAVVESDGQVSVIEEPPPAPASESPDASTVAPRFLMDNEKE